MTSDRMPSLAEFDEGLAGLAYIIRSLGDEGAQFMPIFNRLDREREQLLESPARLDKAMARVWSAGQIATRSMAPSAQDRSSV